MKRQGYLSIITAGTCAGCASVNFGGSEETEPIDSEEETEPADDTENPTENEPKEEGPDPSEQPIIHELSLDYDTKWLLMTRRYEVPNAGDEFTVTEQWHITDADGTTVLEEEREEVVETERNIESVLVSGGIWFISRWDNNIQQGEYTAKLAIVGADGSESNAEYRTIAIESDPKRSIQFFCPTRL